MSGANFPDGRQQAAQQRTKRPAVSVGAAGDSRVMRSSGRLMGGHPYPTVPARLMAPPCLVAEQKKNCEHDVPWGRKHCTKCGRRIYLSLPREAGTNGRAVRGTRSSNDAMTSAEELGTAAAGRWVLHPAFDTSGVAVPAARLVMCEECGTYAPPATREPDLPGRWISGHVSVTGHRRYTETTVQHCVAVQADDDPGEVRP